MVKVPDVLKQDVDRLTGRSLAFMSGVLAHAPKVRDYFMGADSEAYTPVRWRVAQNTVDSIWDWIDFEGNPDSGHLARDYQTAGIIRIKSAAMDDCRRVYNGTKPAVAYALGATIMYAELPKGFGHLDDDYYGVGVRIGQGDFLATAGRVEPQSGRLIVPKGALAAGPVLPISEFPVRIPLP